VTVAEIKRISIAELESFSAKFLAKRGVTADDAAYIAHIAAWTEAFRQSTHGIEQLTTLSKRLGQSADPQVKPVLVRESAAMAAYTGHNCIGQLAMRYAIDVAVAKAKKCGTSTITVANTEWVAALAVYLVPLARQGYMSMLWVESDRGHACAPLGGLESRFSTNPMALAIPADGDPIVADFSTTTMSNGAARVMRDRGQVCEVPRFLDRDGKVSNDPAVIKAGGTMMFMGAEADGHKGYALSIFNEALAFMGGAARDGDRSPWFQSFTLMVMDAEAFAGSDNLRQRMREFAAHLKSSRLRPGFKEIRMPGEGGFRLLAEAVKNGIPLPADKEAMLKRIADENGIDMPSLID
jgi:LDH2 family malate/lactate/ureidoglycolate dehydrogenase